MYSITAYGEMIADHVRMGAYEAALRRAVQPGATVLDIGAGTGILSFIACQLGAGQVYAVEPADAIQVAREIAGANGLANRITFLQDLSSAVTLPQPADVFVSDLRGVLPLFGQHIPAIADARRRLLAPGGVLIPQQDSLWAAVVSAPELYARHNGPWENNAYALDMRAARQITVNTWSKGRVKEEQLLCEPRIWATLDYRTISEPDARGTIEWTAARAGVAHGLCLWFEATLVDGVGFSTRPDAPELIYGSAFFPWENPIHIELDDRITVTIEANLVAEDYIWRWNTRVQGPGPAPEIRADYRQSTFFGAPLSPASLRKRADAFAPTLNERGQIDRLILELMGAQTPLGTIARQVQAQFSERFHTWQEALAHVSDLSEKYSR